MQAISLSLLRGKGLRESVCVFARRLLHRIPASQCEQHPRQLRVKPRARILSQPLSRFTQLFRQPSFVQKLSDNPTPHANNQTKIQSEKSFAYRRIGALAGFL